MPGSSLYDSIQIINALNDPKISTYDKVYIYRQVRVINEFIPQPYPMSITLQNAPIIDIRTIVLSVVDYAASPTTEYWSIANGKIARVEVGTYPDPNAPGAIPQDAIIHLAEEIPSTTDVLFVSYTTITGWQEFDNITSISYEEALDAMADVVQFEVANVDNQYTPGVESSANFTTLMPVESMEFSKWQYDFYGREIPINWELIGMSATSDRSAFVPRSYPVDSWKVQRPGGSIVARFEHEMPISRKLTWRGTINPESGKPVGTLVHFNIRFNFKDKDGTITDTVIYPYSATVGSGWTDYEIELPERPYTDDSYTIQVVLNAEEDVFWYLYDFGIGEYRPLFDHMVVVDYWTGLDTASGVEYMRRGRFFIDEATPSIASARPRLEVKAFSDLGRLSLAHIDLDIRPQVVHFWDETEKFGVGFYPVEGAAGAPAYKKTVWQRRVGTNLEVDGVEYESRTIADWLPISVYTKSDTDNLPSGLLKAFGKITATEIDPYEDVKTRDLKRLSEDEYTVDYQRGWIIFKEPKEFVFVDCYYILEGTNEVEDILSKALLVPSDIPDFLDTSYQLYDKRLEGVDGTTPTVQYNIKRLMKSSGGPGMSIDQLTDMSWDTGSEDFREEFSIQAAIPAQWITSWAWAYPFQSNEISEAGTPKNNWVRPQDELGYFQEIYAPNYETSINEVGVYIEIWDDDVGDWVYWKDLSGNPIPELFIHYKMGMVLIQDIVWDAYVASGRAHATTPIRVAYRYWTLQATGVTANRFVWKIQDGDVQTLFEKVRESLVAPNYVIWDDGDGKVRGNYIVEKPSGSEDFDMHIPASMTTKIAKKNISTKVVSTGAAAQTEEFDFMAWILTGPEDIGFMGSYDNSWNVSAQPPVNQPAFPLYRDDMNLYVSWATNDGIYLTEDESMVGIAFSDIKPLNKVAFFQAYSGGEHNMGGWEHPPVYSIEYLDVDELREMGYDPRHIIAVEEGGFVNPEDEVATERVLGGDENLAFKGIKDIGSSSNKYPWRSLSPSSYRFRGTDAGNWVEIEDLRDDFEVQYLRIKHISGGKFRPQWSDLQWNLGPIKFLADDTIYGIAFLRDFAPGAQPDFNDLTGEFYRPDILRSLQPNPIRVAVLDKDTALQNDTDLAEHARNMLRENLKTEKTLSVSAAFGFYSKLNTVRVIEDQFNIDSNYLIMRINYSKNGSHPEIRLELQHFE